MSAAGRCKDIEGALETATPAGLSPAVQSGFDFMPRWDQDTMKTAKLTNVMDPSRSVLNHSLSPPMNDTKRMAKSKEKFFDAKD